MLKKIILTVFIFIAGFYALPVMLLAAVSLIFTAYILTLNMKIAAKVSPGYNDREAFSAIANAAFGPTAK